MLLARVQVVPSVRSNSKEWQSCHTAIRTPSTNREAPQLASLSGRDQYFVKTVNNFCALAGGAILPARISLGSTGSP